jgi:AcrR family transcriptional regulator
MSETNSTFRFNPESTLRIPAWSDGFPYYRIMTASEGEPGRAPRKDVVRNRARLLCAARRAFARNGLDAPLEPIAAAAGVGNATLYRHFPTRADLWQSVLEGPLLEVTELIGTAGERDDAWSGLEHFLRGLCELEAREEGFTFLMTASLDGAPRLAELRAGIRHRLGGLVQRAHDQKAIRPDVVESDFAVIILSVAGVIEATRDSDPLAWSRHLDIILDGIRTPVPTPLPSASKACSALI